MTDQITTPTGLSPAAVQRRATNHFVLHGLRISDSLRAAADAVERITRNVPVNSYDQLPDHVQGSGDIIDVLNHFHGNLNTGPLLRAAVDADAAAREPQAIQGSLGEAQGGVEASAQERLERIEALMRRWESVPALRRGSAAADLRKALGVSE